MRTSRSALGRTIVLFCLLLSNCVQQNWPEHTETTLALPPAKSPLWSETLRTRDGDWLSVLNTGEQSMDWRLRAIDSATHSIDLQTFLWHGDKAGLAILRHLVEAADRGVRVRLLVDDTFTTSHAREIREVDHHPRIEYRIYNPFRHRPDSTVLRQLLNLAQFERVDHRMHNKALIVDNRVAVIGGRNLGDEYFGDHEEANFRDMDLLCGGPHVTKLSGLFDQFWNNRWSVDEELLLGKSATMRSPEEFRTWLKGEAPLVLEESPAQRRSHWLEMVRKAIPARLEVVADIPAPHDPAVLEERPDQLSEKLIGLLDGAKREIILVTAYLIPTRELEEAIARAEQRGVEVRVLTNSIRSNNHLAAHTFYRKHLQTLVNHGVEVHEVRAYAKDRGLYMERPVTRKHLGLHAKFLLIDKDLAYIGSANLDPRSFNLNTEMGLVVRSEKFNRRMRDLIVVDFHPRNAWKVQTSGAGTLQWIGDDRTLKKQPAESDLQRLEAWFLGLLPVEEEM